MYVSIYLYISISVSIYLSTYLSLYIYNIYMYILTNALLMLNLGKERFIGNIVLKSFFEMTLMSMKNLVYNKLVRQNIFCFINSISILVILTYCYHYPYSCSYYYYPCSSYYYYLYYFYYYYQYYYYFIVIILVLSMLFILFYFILFFIVIVHITMIFVCHFVRRVCIPSLFLFLLLLMIHSIYSHCSYISSMPCVPLSLSFSFFSTLLVIGGEFSKRIRAAWSTLTH